jgi:dTDP-4-dehydrorhamnose reductase
MRILLTGASGFLGQTFCREHSAAHHITGLYRAHRPELPGVRLLRVDLTDHRALAQVLAADYFDACVHTAALADPNACQLDPTTSQAINVHATANVADLCAEHGVALAFTSTDLVFDGRNAPYDETAPAAPVCLYGEHKLRAEAEVLARHPKALVCRMALLYGRTVPGARCLLDGMLQAVRCGQPLRLFADEFRTPLDAADGARGIMRALTSGVSGLLHLGGPERLSRLEFGHILADVLAEIPGWPRPVLQPTIQADVAMPAPRPPDVSLNIARAAGFGFAPAPARQALRAMLAQA